MRPPVRGGAGVAAGLRDDHGVDEIGVQPVHVRAADFDQAPEPASPAAARWMARMVMAPSSATPSATQMMSTTARRDGGRGHFDLAGLDVLQKAEIVSGHAGGATVTRPSRRNAMGCATRDVLSRAAFLPRATSR